MFTNITFLMNEKWWKNYLVHLLVQWYTFRCVCIEIETIGLLFKINLHLRIFCYTFFNSKKHKTLYQFQMCLTVFEHNLANISKENWELYFHILSHKIKRKDKKCDLVRFIIQVNFIYIILLQKKKSISKETKKKSWKVRLRIYLYLHKRKEVRKKNDWYVYIRYLIMPNNCTGSGFARRAPNNLCLSSSRFAFWYPAAWSETWAGPPPRWPADCVVEIFAFSWYEQSQRPPGTDDPERLSRWWPGSPRTWFNFQN